MENLKTLLAEVGRIVQLDAKQREEGEKRGEMFNIFEILKVETDETRAHSAFIAALLNPNGKHGAGDHFLRAFIDTIDCLNDFEFDTQDAKVEIEYSIGNKNEDATEGGRIDILITSTDGSKAVIIENKIYAGDQEKQLVRYANYAKKYSDYRLLYLNLFGSEASEYSVKDESDKTLQTGEDYFQIGYNKEIIDWLDACIADAARLPLVRESIIQYQNLIKKLTNQNKSLMKEISDKILESPANVKSAIEIANSLAEVRETLQKRFWKHLKEKMKTLANEVQFFNDTTSYESQIVDSLDTLIHNYSFDKKATVNNRNYGLTIVVAEWCEYTVSWEIQICEDIICGVVLRTKDKKFVTGENTMVEPIRKFYEKYSNLKWGKGVKIYRWIHPSDRIINFLTLDNPEIYELADDNRESEIIKCIVAECHEYILTLKQLCKECQ